MKTDLSGKVALVNGASRGIGEAIAHGLADCGAKVVCTSRKIEGVQAVADAIVERSRIPAMPVTSSRSNH
jgi:NAD(P)-dependent dehydrogenase (short-subunit alcohol dehydrogenase family)